MPTQSTNNKNEKPKGCFYCPNKEITVDYKDIGNLRHFLSANMKIAPRRRSFLCAEHQRQVARAIKRSREAGLLPYTAN